METKELNVLCIKRDKQTKKAIGYEWACEFINKEPVSVVIERMNTNEKMPFYYEITENEDLKLLLPKKNSRTYTAKDIVDRIECLINSLNEFNNLQYDVEEIKDKVNDFIQKNEDSHE